MMLFMCERIPEELYLKETNFGWKMVGRVVQIELLCNNRAHKCVE